MGSIGGRTHYGRFGLLLSRMADICLRQLHRKRLPESSPARVEGLDVAIGRRALIPHHEAHEDHEGASAQAVRWHGHLVVLLLPTHAKTLHDRNWIRTSIRETKGNCLTVRRIFLDFLIF